MNTVITNQNYIQIVEQLINRAQKEILMTVFCARFKKSNNYPGSKTILEALARAQARNVDIAILLHGGTNFSRVSKWNKASLRRFRDFGLTPKIAASDITLHAKLIIIDEKILIAGSHNLTESSLTRTQELSVAIEDPTLALQARTFFYPLWNRTE